VSVRTVPPRLRWLLLALGAVVVLLAGAAGALVSCGSTSAPPTTTQALSTVVPTNPDALFGSGCGALPTSASDPRSPAAMRRANVRDLVASHPQLSTLYKAARKAGMLHAFDHRTGLTMLMPTNAAFEKVPPLQLRFAMSNKTLITRILKYHVIAKPLTPKQLNLDGPFTTMEGAQLHVYGFGESLRLGVQKAHVICGNVRVQQAAITVYLIDTVLLP
jgi:uncharacterized surface protein with fasciclin (FAS1) repeats